MLYQSRPYLHLLSVVSNRRQRPLFSRSLCLVLLCSRLGDTRLQADQDGAPPSPHGNPYPEQPPRAVESLRLRVPRQAGYSPGF